MDLNHDSHDYYRQYNNNYLLLASTTAAQVDRASISGTVTDNQVQ